MGIPDNFLKQIFQSSPHPYLILHADKEYTISDVNDCYLKATGIKREEVIGRALFDVFPDDPNDSSASGVSDLHISLERVVRCAKTDIMGVQKYDIPLRDGSGKFTVKYWSPVNTPIFGENGSVEFIIHSVEDVTEFMLLKQASSEEPFPSESKEVRLESEVFKRANEVKEINRQIKAREGELARLNAELKEVDQLKTEFFSNISHEFRTPLTLILGPLEKILSNPQEMKGKFAADIETVYRNALRLLKLVNALLDFSRVEAGRAEALFEATDLSAFTADLASNFTSACEEGGVELVVECPPLPFPVEVDREMWEKIVLNLISNALKFTHRGTIRVSMSSEGDFARLRVNDSGVGIEQEEIEKIFERFYRAESSLGRSYEGSGIGLSLVKELVKLQGGSIEVQSEVGAGSTFTVSIPFKAARTDSTYAAKEKSQDIQPFVAEAQQWMHRSKPDVFNPVEESRGSVLVADDNGDMRDYVSRLLEDAGYSVKRASDGHEALRMCRESLPDLLLSDVMMPGPDGLSLLNTLRSDPQTATLPIILLSARADEDFKTEALSAGADEYMTKPFHAAELLARVEGSVKLGRLRCRAEHFYHTVFSSVYEAIIILENNIVIDCNDMAATLFEMTKDEFVGMDILSPAYHFECKGDSFYDYLASASHKGTTTMECSLSLEHHPNKIKVLEMILSNFAAEENKQIVIARDITQKLEEEKRFKMQARQAQLGEMISMIAHQWRQPLAIINAIAAQMRLKELMKEKEDPQLIENLTKIEQQCVHLSQTISDFRDLSSPNKEKEYVSLPQLVDHAINLLDHTFKNSSVKVAKVPGVEIGVVTFYNEVLQVLITLLKNSVDACEENKIGNCTISVSVDQEDEYFTIRVHDNAGGIPADLINKLFTPYFTTKEGSNGTGLGLYMSKMIIEEHCRGLLEVSSEAQESTFLIKLPKSLPL